MTSTASTATAKQIDYITSLLTGTYHLPTVLTAAGINPRKTMRNLTKTEASALIDHLTAA